VLGAGEIALRLVARGDIPPALGRVTSGGRPFVSVLFIAAVSVGLVLISEINDIVAIANVAALLAMIIVNVAAVQLWRKGWPGTGIKLPGGPLIPVVAMLACLGQFPSLNLDMVVLGTLFVAAGLVIFYLRHEHSFGHGVADQAEAAVAAGSTPLARAMLPPTPLDAVEAVEGAVEGVEEAVEDVMRATRPE
jgi:amino acid transporter